MARAHRSPPVDVHDGRRAWTVVAALAATEVVSWGVLYYAFGVFFDAMREDLGWSASALAGAFSLALLVSAAMGIPVGHWLDDHGARVLMTAGSVLGALLVLGWSRVDSVLGLYLVWAGVGVAMAMVFYEPAFTIVVEWFDEHRRRALTTLTVLGALAGFVFAPLSAWLISTFGWRHALVVLAAVLAAVTIPLHALVLRRPLVTSGAATPGGSPTVAAMSTGPAGRNALREAPFWLLTCAVALASATSTALAVHLAPALIADGHSLAFAATVLGLMGIALIPGRLVFGMLARLPHVILTTASFALPVAALGTLLTWSNPAAVITFALSFGVGNGMKTLILATTLSDWYGTASYGALSGVAALPIRIAQAAGPILAGVLHAVTADYHSVLVALLAVSVIATLAAALAEARMIGRR